MKIGVILPTFRADAASVLERAGRVSDLGLDGVFAYDHLFPPGEPERPSLSPFPLLSAVAAREERLVLGPLVARVGHGSPEHISASVRALETLAPGRVRCALGVGDAQARLEMAAFGLVTTSVSERRDELATIARSLDVPVWIGGKSEALVALADQLGAALNLWQSPLGEVERWASTREVTWAGVAPDDVEPWLDALATAGVSWCVVTSRTSLERLAAWSARR